MFFERLFLRSIIGVTYIKALFFPKMWEKDNLSEISDTFYLYSDSYRSLIRTPSPDASRSIVSNRGIFPPDAISATVDFGTPVRIDT